jgi:hypothetical protein
MMAQLLTAALSVSLIAGPRALTAIFSAEDRAAFRESFQRLKADKRRYRFRYALGLTLMVASIAIGIAFMLRVWNMVGRAP